MMSKYALLWIAVLSGTVAGYKWMSQSRTPPPTAGRGASRWLPILSDKAKLVNKDLALVNRIKADLRRNNDDYMLWTSRRPHRRDGGAAAPAAADQTDIAPPLDTHSSLPDDIGIVFRAQTNKPSPNDTVNLNSTLNADSGSVDYYNTSTRVGKSINSSNTDIEEYAPVGTVNARSDDQDLSKAPTKSEVNPKHNLIMGRQKKLQQIIKDQKARLATAISKLAESSQKASSTTRQLLPHIAYFTRSTHSSSGTHAPRAAPALDMLPAKGSRILALRDKSALCDRSVLDPEGPKYSARGFVMAQEAHSWGSTRGDFVLPKCCNCCKKSVLGCL